MMEKSLRIIITIRSLLCIVLFATNCAIASPTATDQEKPSVWQRLSSVFSGSQRMKNIDDQKIRLQQQRQNFKNLTTKPAPTVNKAKSTNPQLVSNGSGFNPRINPLNSNYKQQLEQLRQRYQQRQQNTQPRRLEPSNTKEVWNLRNADIRQVISEVSRQTGKKFIVDPRVQGKVTIIANTAINKDEIYQVFLSMLEVAGYTAIEQGHVTKIIPNIQSRYAPAPVVSNLTKMSGDAMIVRVIPMKYVAADQLIPVLRPLLPNWNLVNAYRPSNSIIVVGSADNVERVVQIIQRVDTASHNGIDLVPLQYAIASDVVKTINSLNQAGARGTGPSVSVASDDHSNSVLISGSRPNRLRMKVLISQLDNQSPSGINGNTQVVYLEYMEAKDIVPILAGVARSQFSGSVGTTIGTKSITDAPPIEGGSSLSSSAQGATTTQSRLQNQQNAQASQSQSNQGSSGPKIEIIAEPNTNAVILNAPPNIMRVLKSVIAKLDIRPAQVLVEAMIAEVSENNIQNLGIEWGQLGTAALNTSSSSSTAGVFQSGFGFINKDFFHDLVGTLRFLANDDQANILSTPSLVVLDNHLAHIKVGNEVSIIRSSQPSNAEGTTTGTPFNTFDRESVGLVLNVTPQITKNNSIKLSISHQNNTPRNVDDTSGRQAFNISEIQTSVIVRSGDVVVLGGLTQNQYLNNTVKTPYVGDIPGFGNLLKRSQKTRNRKKLMVFLRPIILRSSSKGVVVTNSKYDLLRDAQVDMMSKISPRHQPQDYVLPQHKTRKHLPPPFMIHDVNHDYVK